jgi:hypothetical protein
MTDFNISSIVAARYCRTDHVENISFQLVHWCVRNLLPSNGRCSQSHYLATGLHATVYHLWIRNVSFIVRKYHEIIASRNEISKPTSKYIHFADCFNLNRYILGMHLISL